MSTLTPDSELMYLLDRIAAQDDSALKALYESTSSKLFGLALRIVRHRDVAEDVLQEAFLSIWRGAGNYRASLSPPMAWMGLIVRSRAWTRCASAAPSAATSPMSSTTRWRRPWRAIRPTPWT